MLNFHDCNLQDAENATETRTTMSPVDMVRDIQAFHRAMLDRSTGAVKFAEMVNRYAHSMRPEDASAMVALRDRLIKSVLEVEE